MKCSYGSLDSVEMDNIVVTQSPATNWPLVLIIIAVVILIVSGVCGFFVGKSGNKGASAAQAPSAAAENDKVVNKANEADVAEADAPLLPRW